MGSEAKPNRIEEPWVFAAEPHVPIGIILWAKQQAGPPHYSLATPSRTMGKRSTNRAPPSGLLRQWIWPPWFWTTP
jgi:hypothetical protein